MTIAEALEFGRKQLKKAGIDSARIDASLLLEKATTKPRAVLFGHLEDKLDDTTAHLFIELINERAKRRPLVHLTNHREFYGLDFYINEDVLTPRVETEKMVEFAIKHTPQNGKLIDIGTGSGAIAIAVKTHRPDLKVWASEVTDEALAVARRNVAAHALNITLIKSDLFGNIDETFDTVATNLPYLRNDADLMPEVQKEPGIALFGGDDGLDLYRRFLTQLPRHLAPNGYLFTECDPWQQANLMNEAAQQGLQQVEEDYFILGFRAI